MSSRLVYAIIINYSTEISTDLFHVCVGEFIKVLILQSLAFDDMVTIILYFKHSTLFKASCQKYELSQDSII